jgi:hypothetical protein
MLRAECMLRTEGMFGTTCMLGAECMLRTEGTFDTACMLRAEYMLRTEGTFGTTCMLRAECMLRTERPLITTCKFMLKRASILSNIIFTFYHIRVQQLTLFSVIPLFIKTCRRLRKIAISDY